MQSYVRRLLYLGAILAPVALCALLEHSKGQDRPSPAELFVDVTHPAGISWRHFNGESPDRLLIGAMGGGAAFLDFDQDGRLDVFL